MNFQSFVNNTLNEEQIRYKIVLDPANKSELKQHIYSDTNENLNCKCPITMICFKNEESVTKLPCCHLFNSDAIEEWVLNNQATCPVCRFQLKNTIEIRHQPTTDAPTDALTDAPINSLINYINDSLLYINNIQYNPTEIYEDISGNLTEDISGNLTEDISEDNDVILNTLSNYVSTINNIINRRIEEEDNNIMQEVILSSLREQ
jgi:hypothetical protein